MDLNAARFARLNSAPSIVQVHQGSALAGVNPAQAQRGPIIGRSLAQYLSASDLGLHDKKD